MSFDRLAPHYRWMEWVLAGRKLQRCRTAFLGSIRPPRRALLLGEGNGRFLCELLRRYPDAEVTCLDASSEMLAAARAQVNKANLSSAKVEWVHQDILKWQPSRDRKRYDLIATHFFFDCFRPEEVERIVTALTDSAAPGAQWLIADFHEPSSGLRKHRARMILFSMYLFFRCVTGISARRLPKPDAALLRAGFTLHKRAISEWGLLQSNWWIRSSTDTLSSAAR